MISNTNDYFDYPSVFRPIFGLALGQNVLGANITNIYIRGYVEVTNVLPAGSLNADYNLPCYSLTLPSDWTNIVGGALARFTNINGTFVNIGGMNMNIYGIPWVIGAKKGLPNFNQISLESITELTRRVQIIKNGKPRPNWQTNVQYVVSISNALEAEAWNSYSNNYTRPVMIGVADALTTTLSNQFGVIPISIQGGGVVTNPQIANVGLSFPIVVNNWPGLGFNLTSGNLPNTFPISVADNHEFFPLEESISRPRVRSAHSCR